MAWVSPRVYAILSSSEEGKDIIEQLPDMTQDECSQALDEFFGKGGKGYKSNAEYSQAKMDDETEERIYKEMGDEEVSEKDYEDDDEEEIPDLDKDTFEKNYKQALETNNYEKAKAIYDRQVADKGEDSPEAKGTKKALDEMKENFDQGENHIDNEEEEYERNKKQFKDFIVNHENYKPMVSAIKTEKGLQEKLMKQGYLNSQDNYRWHKAIQEVSKLTRQIEKDYEDKIGMSQFMSASAITEYELMEGK